MPFSSTFVSALTLGNRKVFGLKRTATTISDILLLIIHSGGYGRLSIDRAYLWLLYIKHSLIFVGVAQCTFYECFKFTNWYIIYCCF